MAFTVRRNGNGSTGGSVPVDSTAYANLRGHLGPDLVSVLASQLSK
jgi:hypothetical protein